VRDDRSAPSQLDLLKRLEIALNAFCLVLLSQSSADNFLLDCGGLRLSFRLSSSDSAQNFHADVFKLIGNFRDLIEANHPLR